MESLKSNKVGKYILKSKIGSGSFGNIYFGVHADTGYEYAIKMEHTKSKNQLLLYEREVYKILSDGIGIPLVEYSGVENEYHVMVMELLGPSLEDLFNYCNRKFSLKTILMLADQLDLDNISSI